MQSNKLVNISIIFIAAIALVFVLKTFKMFLLPLTLAMIVAILIVPLLNFSKKCKIPTTLTLFGLIIVIFLISFLIGLIFYVEIVKVDTKIVGYSQNINNFINYATSKFLAGSGGNIIKDLIDAQSATNFLKSGFNSFKSFITGVILVIIFTIFIVPSYMSFVNRLGNDLNTKEFRKLQITIFKVEKSIRDYLYIKLIIGIATAVVSGIIMLAFGIDFVFVLALTIFILNFIPNIGSIIATIFPVIFFILKFGLGIKFIVFIVLMIAVQIIFGNIIEPKFAGKKLRISPVIILISLLFWFWVWGIAGMLIAVPLTAVIKIALEHFESGKIFAKCME